MTHPSPILPEDQLAARRARAAAELALTNEFLLIPSGSPIPIPGGFDQRYDFLPHPHFRHLTGGLAIPHSYLAFDPHEGWTEFLHRPTLDEQVWEAAQPVARGHPTTDLPAYLAKHKDRPFALIGSPNDLPNAPQFPAPTPDPALAESINHKLLHARRPKDPHELALLRDAAVITATGFAHLRPLIRPGQTERALQIELESAFYRNGADRTAFGTIIASGPNAAVLHFPPTDKPLSATDLLLVDAGAARHGYVADVTRTYLPDNPTTQQRDLYLALLAAQIKAIARCRPGTEWSDVHLATAHDLAAALRDLGILLCDPDTAIDTEVIARFFPHGVGHMTGLGVRDAGGQLPSRDPSARFAGARLRVNLPIQENYLMTIEPGLYFIPPLLAAARADPKHSPLIHWPTVEHFLPVGGMRIEDNVLITNNHPKVLTAAIPK